MFERETKREKILEARQREMRLKERSRSQQSREEEPGRDQGQDGADQLIARAEREFYSVVEAELRKSSRVTSRLWSAPAVAHGDDEPAFFCFHQETEQ